MAQETITTTASNSLQRVKPHALVVGLGIAGLATANRLSRIGWDVTIIERSQGRRKGGYFIALFNSGKKPADRMGLYQNLHNRAATKARAWDIDRYGNKNPGMGYSNLTGNGANRNGDLMLRGDVENAGFKALPHNVTIRYATTATSIVQDADGVNVTLEERGVQGSNVGRFDLVVGADGIHSTTRKMAFDLEESDVLVPTGNMIVAFTLDEAVPGFVQEESFILSEEGRSVWLFAFKDHAPTVLFSYRVDDLIAEKKKNPYRSVRDAYTAGGVELGDTLEYLMSKFEQADEFLFDSADQVHMDTWHRGRVVLLGDSAWCLTLYSGMGASSALAGADSLGTILQRNGNDVVRSLSQWEDHMRPFIDANMKSGWDMRSFFTANSKTEMMRRKVLTGFMRVKATKALGQALGKRMMRHKVWDIAATA